MRRAPLHVRLAVGFGAAMALVVILLLTLTLWSDRGFERELRQRLNLDVARHLAEHAVPLTPEGVDQDQLKGMLMHVMSVNPSLEVYLLDPHGRILAFDAPPGHVKSETVDLAPVERLLDGTPPPVLGDDPRAPGHASPFSAWPLEQAGQRLGYVYVVVGGETYRSTAGPLRWTRERRLYALAALALLALGLAASTFLAHRLTRPLRLLRDAIRDDRRSPSRALLASDDEIGLLAREVQRLEQRVEEQMEALRRVDRNRREFVACVSHDLRTPLASLTGYLDLLDGRPEVEDPAREQYLGIARRRVGHLTRLVEQLFELARLEAGDVPAAMERFNLAELTQDVLQGMRPRASEAGVQLVCHMPRTLPLVAGDLGLMERALSNLVDNALKFTPRGGQVHVRLRSQRRDVSLSVSDDGPGISREDLPRVFERRFRGAGRRRAGGTGLGLAISQRVLELHGSAIDVQSEEGRGATFRFVLHAA